MIGYVAKMTLTQRLCVLVGIALLPAIVIQANNELDLRRSRQAELHDFAERQAQLAASAIDQIFTGVRGLLVAVAEVPSIRALDTPACVGYLATLQPRVPHLASLAALDLEGRVACRQQLPPADLRFSDRSYFREAIATGRFVVGEFTDGRVVERPILPLALPLRETAGRIIGVVAAALDLSWLTRQLEERGLADNGSVTIADRNGIILARVPLPERFVGTRIPEPYQELIHAPAPGATEVLSQDGTRRILGYVPVTAARPYYVSAGINTDEAFAANNRATLRGLALIGVGLALALAMAWLIGDRFFRDPVARLLAAAERWRRGDYTVRIGPRPGEAEFGRLAQAFDGMVGEVARRQAERDRLNQALQGSEDRLKQFNAELEQRVERMLAERRQHEEVLRHAQKMQAVGLLAGGVAHDFNNLLTAISGQLRHLRRGVAEELRPAIQGIELAVRRGERVARQLLAFTRVEPAHSEAVDLREAVTRILPLLEKSLQGGYAVATELTAEPCPVQLDVADLELALLNLLTNARDAMPDGGAIRITVAREASGTDPGRVVLGVHDSGSGMTPEVRERAFEPFFTTKGVGDGSGLGLAGVYGFARQNGGTAWIESEPGKGTSVFVAVPAGRPLQAPEPAEADPPTATPPGVAAAEQGRRVLVVEDDALVCMVTVDALEEAGYVVVAARNGVEALAVLEQEGATLSAVVTDLAMPGGVSGTDVAREVGRRHPDLALILTTGYTPDRIPTEEMPRRFAFVAKPFAAENLVERLKALLAQSPAARSA
ncbi:MAG: ATP-binding protein [Geminicoccaceae bacterium]